MEYDDINETTWGDTNSDAAEYRRKYQEQFTYLRRFFLLDVRGPEGLTAGYRSTDDECKQARVSMEGIEFKIDVTAGIVNQVVAGLLATAENFIAEARRLEQHVADGKFPKPK